MGTSCFRKFFRSEDDEKLLQGFDLEGSTEICFDYTDFCNLIKDESFSTALKNSAQNTLACCGLALCSLREIKQRYDGLAPRAQRIEVRFVSVRPKTPIAQLKSNY